MHVLLQPDFAPMNWRLCCRWVLFNIFDFRYQNKWWRLECTMDGPNNPTKPEKIWDKWLGKVVGNNWELPRFSLFGVFVLSKWRQDLFDAITGIIQGGPLWWLEEGEIKRGNYVYTLKSRLGYLCTEWQVGFCKQDMYLPFKIEDMISHFKDEILGAVFS